MELFDWLFSTGAGVASLIFGGMLLFGLIAFFAERKTHKMYFNHPETDDEEGFFDGLLKDFEDELEDDDTQDKHSA